MGRKIIKTIKFNEDEWNKISEEMKKEMINNFNFFIKLKLLFKKHKK